MFAQNHPQVSHGRGPSSPWRVDTDSVSDAQSALKASGVRAALPSCGSSGSKAWPLLVICPRFAKKTELVNVTREF